MPKCIHTLPTTATETRSFGVAVSGCQQNAQRWTVLQPHRRLEVRAMLTMPRSVRGSNRRSPYPIATARRHCGNRNAVRAQTRGFCKRRQPEPCKVCGDTGDTASPHILLLKTPQGAAPVFAVVIQLRARLRQLAQTPAAPRTDVCWPWDVHTFSTVLTNLLPTSGTEWHAVSANGICEGVTYCDRLALVDLYNRRFVNVNWQAFARRGPAGPIRRTFYLASCWAERLWRPCAAHSVDGPCMLPTCFASKGWRHAGTAPCSTTWSASKCRCTTASLTSARHGIS